MVGLDSRRVKISLVAILIAGAVFVYHTYTIDVIKEIVDTIMNILRRSLGVV